MRIAASIIILPIFAIPPSSLSMHPDYQSFWSPAIGANRYKAVSARHDELFEFGHTGSGVRIVAPHG